MKNFVWIGLRPVLFRNRAVLTAFLFVASVLRGHAAEPAWLEELHSPDVAIRRAAMDEIQTLDDPRIPEACLPLLNDDGESIRRLAARAIGSRFDQIPKARVDVYVQALKKCAARGPGDAALMASRAIGLLTHDYSSASFSKSPGGQWVLYERRRLPVIASIELQTHTLLLPKGSGEGGTGDTYIDDGNVKDSQIPRDPNVLKLMVTNEPVSDLFEPAWHPRGIALAFSPVVQMKFFHPICIWRASDGKVKIWSVESFAPLLHGRFPHWSTTTDFVKWDGPRAIIKVYDCDDGGGGEPFDPKGILVSVDVRNWKTAIVR